MEDPQNTSRVILNIWPKQRATPPDVLRILIFYAQDATGKDRVLGKTHTNLKPTSRPLSNIYSEFQTLRSIHATFKLKSTPLRSTLHAQFGPKFRPKFRPTCHCKLLEEHGPARPRSKLGWGRLCRTGCYRPGLFQTDSGRGWGSHANTSANRGLLI